MRSISGWSSRLGQVQQLRRGGIAARAAIAGETEHQPVELEARDPRAGPMLVIGQKGILTTAVSIRPSVLGDSWGGGRGMSVQQEDGAGLQQPSGQKHAPPAPRGSPGRGIEVPDALDVALPRKKRQDHPPGTYDSRGVPPQDAKPC